MDSLSHKSWEHFKDRRLILALVAIVPTLVAGLVFAFEATVGISFLIVGLALLAISAEKAVEHSVGVATALKLSLLMIGLVVVSLGTDFPEIVNSIISSALGHVDINVGDSFGSVLTQMTLVLGLFPFIWGAFRVKREEIVVMGAREVLAFIASVSMVEKGYISRMNAFFPCGQLTSAYADNAELNEELSFINLNQWKILSPSSPLRSWFHRSRCRSIYCSPIRKSALCRFFSA